MNTMLLKLYVKFQDLMSREEGQDLVEYALVVGLISIAAVTGLKGVASAVNNVITGITSTLNTAA
ncbi:MAG: Flp family type IVb pilin [Terracidiphilus sp.]|jgi:pilus assembly protein Flp/PilA